MKINDPIQIMTSAGIQTGTVEAVTKRGIIVNGTLFENEQKGIWYQEE